MRGGPRVDDAQRRVQHVAALAVLQTQQRSVRREAAPVEARTLRSRHPQPIGAPQRLFRRSSVDRDVDREPVAIAHRGGHDAGRLCEPFVPAERDAVQVRPGVAAGERRREPPAGLVARLVLPPQDVGAIHGDGSADDADRVIGDLAPRA